VRTTRASGESAAPDASASSILDVVDRVAASYPYDAWRTSTLSSYLGLLNAAGRHAAVLAAFHRVNDDVKKYADGCLTIAVNERSAANADRTNGRERHTTRPLRTVGVSGGRDGDDTRGQPSARIQLVRPHVALDGDALGVVVSSCVAAGKWRLAIAAVEQLANYRDLALESQRGSTDHSTTSVDDAELQDAATDGAAVKDPLGAVLSESFEAVCRLCERSGYPRSQWRVPNEIP
jgi:hypothetical protein